MSLRPLSQAKNHLIRRIPDGEIDGHGSDSAPIRMTSYHTQATLQFDFVLSTPTPAS